MVAHIFQFGEERVPVLYIITMFIESAQPKICDYVCWWRVNANDSVWWGRGGYGQIIK